GVLAQDPAGLARGVALDPAARRVRSIAADSGAPERRAVGPHGVEVPAVEEHRAVPRRPVERGTIGGLGPGVGIPPAPEERRGGGLSPGLLDPEADALQR